MAREEMAPQGPERLTEEQAERMLAEMNDVIRAGEETRKLRSEMIKLFAGFGWTQEKISQLTDMSQPAVSKQVSKYKNGDPLPPMEFSLDQDDAPWLEGRLWGLAEVIAEILNCTARCTRSVHAIGRGKKRFTPRNVDELRRLVEDDLMLRRAEIPGSYRDAYDEISRGLDVPVPVSSKTATTPVSLRRALARQIQRDRLRGDA
jgi:hypothetical protein